ncbi:hypothetical protein HEK616_82840 (plasmid) [Streptomyces nigrescens]|uniref:Uncharacterized protein n=1 Tax=Streptomyces nigrescens TaxID=1920 RepID=A0ABM8A839_STRNI|nr:hypothetical protein [Streptomyces nigrescens]BDM74797.1 hypothetical protein HEK616_82840 [Streptomyces nigrescens]
MSRLGTTERDYTASALRAPLAQGLAVLIGEVGDAAGWGVGDAAPECAVVCGVGDAGADVPAVMCGDRGSSDFVGVEADALLVGSGVPVDI